jgi:glycosyltransferase involved in cell wall biosynthesis
MTATATSAATADEPGAEPQISVIVPTRDRPGPLAACLAALEAQTVGSFEVVVVDDGSQDAAAVAGVVAGAPHARLVRGAGCGPAAARNLGAGAARGAILCFTDDDCRPGPGWVDALAGRIAGGAAAVAGPTRNGRPRDACAAASQAVTNHLTGASLDASSGRVAFAPTSNLSCRAAVHRSLPFDEDYPLAAGEDRDWCSRLAARGVALDFEPSAWVTHHQDLSLRRFWRQQVRYGRGAYRWQRGRAPGARLQPMGFYTGLLRAGFAEGLLAGLLVMVAQVATAVGLAAESLDARRRRTANSSSA